VPTIHQELTVNQPTEAIRLRGRAAASLISVLLLIAGCGGPEGAGTVNMSAVKEAAARRGIAGAGQGGAGAVNRPAGPERSGPAAPAKVQRRGHQ
jgi:hypothetical protein